MAEIQSSNATSVENPFHNPHVLRCMQGRPACGGARSQRSYAPRGTRRANLRSELLALAERADEPSLKSDLARLAESLMPVQHQKRSPLTESQIRNLLYIAKSRPEWKALHALLLFVGCGGFHCSDLFRIRRGDVVLDRGKPRISIAAGPHARGFRPSRVVILSPLLAEAAETLLTSSEQWGSHLPEHYLLVCRTSKYGNHPCDPMKPAYIKLFRRQFDDVRSLADCPEATWRQLELSGRMEVVEC